LSVPLVQLWFCLFIHWLNVLFKYQLHLFNVFLIHLRSPLLTWKPIVKLHLRNRVSEKLLQW
jgi:hypothetical protein